MLRSTAIRAILALAAPGGCTGERTSERASGRSASVWIAGDLNLGPGGVDVLAPLAEVLAGGSGIVNLEGPVGQGESRAERLVNAPSGMELLVRHGVAVAGIANNHSLDLGPGGVAATRQALGRAGIAAAAGDDIAVIEPGGVRLAVTAHDVTAQGAEAEIMAMQAAVARARRRAELVIATVHVRGPPSYLPPPELVAAVEAAVDAGAHVVAAHGTHAVARVERRGEVVIAWGLGNLAFACPCTHETDGLILRLELQNGRISTAEIIPIDAGLAGAPARPAEAAELTLELLQALGSSPLTRTGSRARL